MSKKLVAYKLTIHDGDKIWKGPFSDAECYYSIEDGEAIRYRFGFLRELNSARGEERFNVLNKMCKEVGYDTKYHTYRDFCRNSGCTRGECLGTLEKIVIERQCRLLGIKNIKDCVEVKYTDKIIKGYEHSNIHMHTIRKIMEMTLREALINHEDIKDIMIEVIKAVKEIEEKKKESNDENKERLITDINCFVAKICTPTYEREVENKNRNTFDFIRVFINLPSSEVMDKESIRKGLDLHYKEMCHMVLDKIEGMKRYQRFGVPVSALKLSKATVEYKSNRVMFIFELKDELRNLKLGEIEEENNGIQS